MTSTLTSQKTLVTIQALRAIAVSTVVSYDVLFMLVHNGGYSLYVPDLGASGIDLFFVISGFIMIYTNLTAFCSQTPLHRSFVVGYPDCANVFALHYRHGRSSSFAPRLFSSVEFTWTYVVSSYLFLLSENSAGQVGTVIQTGWSLYFEVYFYLLFAIFLNLPPKYFLIASGAVFAIDIILGNVSQNFPPWATVATEDPV